MPLTPGARLGPYEILGAIGAGGMGEVYRARDSKLNRDVAIKVLPTSFAQDPERLARFRREAQVLAALNHPNIAHIHGFEDSTDAHGLVMELVEGPTLADRIAHGPMPLADALPIAKQIAEAMEAAHEQGIVHRDLKPSNVKVKDDGTVKVLDFGLAKLTEATESAGGTERRSAENSPTLTARATQMGMILGTAAYMAPEQAKGRTVDRRADIWAFGVVLFEMISGRRGYEADDISETLAAVLTREVDWTAMPASTPARLKALIKDCLVRDPRQRLRDIGDARRAIERLIEGAQDDAVPSPAAGHAAPPARGRALPWFVTGLAIVVAGITSSVAFRPAPRPPAATVSRAATVLKDLAAFIDISADGTKVAYAVAGGSKSTLLALRLLNEFEGKPIPGTEGAVFPVFSPDGQWIAYSGIVENKIRKIPLTGGTSVPIADGVLVGGAAWGGADEAIVFSTAAGLVKVPGAGGTPVAMTRVDAAKGEAAHTRPQFLPGNRLLFTIEQSDTSAGPQFAVLDLAAGTYRTVARGGANGQYVASGHLVYARGGSLFAVPFDLDSLTVAGTEVPVVERVSQVGPPGTANYAVSTSGLLVYFMAPAGASGTTLAWSDRAGKATPLPGQSTREWGTGRLSPNGLFVANGISDASGGRDLWIFDVTRGTPTRVTFGGFNDFPVWTSDSRRIYYSGTIDGKVGIYRAPADGSSRPELVIATPQAVTTESISTDGRTLVYAQPFTDRPPRLMVLDLDGKGQAGQPRPLHETTTADVNGQISPDGRWVAYVSAESGAFEVYLHAFPIAGPRVRVSTDGGTWPRWSRDGKELFFWTGLPSNRLMVSDIPAGDALRASPPRIVFPLLVGTTWDVTPDRNKFLIELTTTTQTTGVGLATVTNWFEELRQRAPKK